MRILALLLLSTASSALAQQAPPAGEALSGVPPVAEVEPEFDPDAELDSEESEADTIVVTGVRNARPRGSVIGDIEPEVTLDGRDVRAYGASNLGELLEELAPLTGSIQGRGGEQPVVLLGGRRISSFREIRDLPPEAVVRVEILPEQVARLYGYRADQKVVNFVLRRRIDAVTGELETRQATSGGRQGYEADFNYLRIAEGSRFSLDAELERLSPLFETERDLVDADPDRTLLPASTAAKLNGSYNRTVFGNVAATLNGELEGRDTRAALGRSIDGSQRLLRDGQVRNVSLGYALNGDLSDWIWSLTGGYERNQNRTLTDRDLGLAVGRDRARSVSQTISSEAVASGSLFDLPAGDVQATLKAGFSLRDIASDSRRAGLFTETDLSRDQVDAQANLDLPLLDDDSPAGALSVNLNGRLEQLSDFGTLLTYGYGFNWEPIEAVRLIGSVTHDQSAPTMQQLGDPVVATPNVRVFDVATGRTVDITRVDGGNPELLANDRRLIAFGLTLRPAEGLTVLANYSDTRSDSPTASFPTATPEIEAAFPDRFERDAAGDLLRIDGRPVNFRRSSQRQLRWGFNFTEVLEGPRPTGPDGQPLTDVQIEERRAERREMWRQRQREGGGGGARGQGAWQGRGEGRALGGGDFGRGGFGGGRQGRIQLGLFHTWRLEDRILIRPGVPELDLLNGSAIGGRGGQPRHEVQLRAGYNRRGLGIRLNVDWQSATTVRADPTSGLTSPQDLRFGDLTTVNLRLFADLGQQRALVRAVPFFRGARITFAVDNLFDARLRVRDANGAVPVGYQPDLLDPLGRSVRLTFRKLFF